MNPIQGQDFRSSSCCGSFVWWVGCWISIGYLIFGADVIGSTLGLSVPTLKCGTSVPRCRCRCRSHAREYDLKQNARDQRRHVCGQCDVVRSETSSTKHGSRGFKLSALFFSRNLRQSLDTHSRLHLAASFWHSHRCDVANIVCSTHNSTFAITIADPVSFQLFKSALPIWSINPSSLDVCQLSTVTPSSWYLRRPKPNNPTTLSPHPLSTHPNRTPSVGHRPDLVRDPRSHRMSGET